MERKIGEIFTYNGKLYQVVKGFSCNGCAFIKNGNCYLDDKFLGPCAYIERTDKTSVIFKLINNMEIKNNQLTIDIPEGMEIDLENSNLAKGIVKFKKKDITYENVEDALKLGKNCKSIIINESNASKLVALSKLMNISKYYNGDWKPNWNNSKENKFCIKFDYHKDRLYVDYNNSIGAGDVFFKNSEDARTVINNPNFRDILDKIYKD